MSNKASSIINNNNAQIIASNPEQSVWVSANAGTGKTHVLINRILRLLLSGTPPHKILCLTFTKAASAEVANRLRDSLGNWAVMNDLELAKSLESILGTEASDKEILYARALFASILEIPEGLRIRTVHSFAESLLGRFPIEAGLAPHFLVIDERRAAEIRTEARDQIIVQESLQNDQLTRALSNLAYQVNEDQLENLMQELYSERQRLRHLINNPDELIRMNKRTRKTLGLVDTDTEESIVKDASSNDKCINKKALYHAVKALQNGTKPDQDRAKEIETWLNMEPKQRVAQFEKTYAHIFLTKKYELRKESTLITKKPKEEYPEALCALLNERDRIFLVFKKLKAIVIAEATQSLLIFGTALIKAYEDIKASRALLDYDDLIEKAEGLLEKESGVSWVHYKLDGGIDHILVDEAQDTSPAQWNIVSRLAGDFFTGLGTENYERPQNRTVFAVGDEKQSIYSFQGADPIRFGLMHKHFYEQEAAIGRKLPIVELEASFRTTSAVLSLVDEVFASSEAFDGMTWNNKAIHHSTNRQGQAGLVELWDTITTDDVEDTRPWDLPFDKNTAESPIVQLAEKIAKRIQDWLQTGEILQSTGRPITPGDIMILVPQRKPFVEEILRALKRYKVPVIGRDRLVLTDHLAAMDLIAIGRFVLLPGDNLNTAVVLKGPFIEFDDDILFTLAHGRSKSTSLWQTLIKRREENTEFARAWKTLSSLLAKADYKPPFEFYSQLLNNGGRRNLLAHLGSEASEPIDEFLALTLDFEHDHEPSLEGFLYWLERGKTEVKREMERGVDEVRVLTVHSAKGLESNIVFLPDTCKLPSTKKNPNTHWGNSEDDDNFVLWRASKEMEEDVSKDLFEASQLSIQQEYRRLLYVAMTRARERLYICGWEGKRRKKGCWYDLIYPVFEKKGEKISLYTGENLWRIETPQIVTPNENKIPTKRIEVVQTLPKWALMPAPPVPLPAKPLVPSRPTEEDPPSISPVKDNNKRFQRGLLVHRLLQNLPNIPSKDREAVGKDFLRRPSLNLASNECEEILRETLAVINHPKHFALFGPGSLAEVPITGVLGLNESSTVISGQIDRLLIYNDTVTIIDYKTNRPPPENEKDVDKVYLKQMATYRDLVKSIYPDYSVQTLLLWTVGPKIMLLSNQILDDHAT
jgi:ATP-dependent helicase/nuclease subunit A